MSNIPLRAYERKIEELIEQNHLPEAVAHCKHILKSFPKNISTYRILGKAFLEAKQYNQTADVFKRVLTVFPDDFISHVGMSIVRENENNLDAAIWHMELAFDSQPSNIAIQEELKRLFGRRDGTHPTKIRLTRGALVRMYARGELYQQAIAEINSALNEDIKRLDLEVFLARMYFLSGDQAAAISACQKLGKDLPYCYEVNKIMFESAPTSSQTDKSNSNMSRLIELDPYYASINPKFPSVDDVPDDKVMIDELSDSSVAEAAKDASWVSNLDNSWDRPPVVPEPGNNESKPEMTAADSMINAEDLFPDSKDTSPDLLFEEKKEETQPIESMKSDDWLPETDVSSSIQSEPGAFSASSQPAEVPDWLRSLVPEDDAAAPEQVSSQSENQLSSDLNPFEYSSEPAASSQDDNTKEVSTPLEDEKAEPIGNADLPDWLKNFDTEKSTEPVSQDDLPDWLNSLQTPALKPEAASPTTPTFDLDSEQNALVEPAPSILDHLEDVKLPESIHPDLVDENPTFVSDEAPIGETPSHEVEGEAETSADSPESEIPDWIRKLQNNSDDVESEEYPVAAEPEPTPIIDISDTISSADHPQIETGSVGSNQTISEQTGDELLEWLRDLKPEEGETTSDESEFAPQESGNTDSLAYDFEAELRKLNPQTPSNSDQDNPVMPVEESETSSPIDDTDDFLARLSGSQATSQLPEENDFPELDESLSLKLDEQIEGLGKVIQTPEPSTEGFATPVDDSFTKVVAPEPAIQSTTASEVVDEIENLLIATQNKPDDYLSWQKLGDAYAANKNYADALNAYSKAEQILINLK